MLSRELLKLDALRRIGVQPVPQKRRDETAQATQTPPADRPQKPKRRQPRTDKPSES